MCGRLVLLGPLWLMQRPYHKFWTAISQERVISVSYEVVMSGTKFRIHYDGPGRNQNAPPAWQEGRVSQLQPLLRNQFDVIDRDDVTAAAGVFAGGMEADVFVAGAHGPGAEVDFGVGGRP